VRANVLGVLTKDAALPQRVAERIEGLRGRPIDATEKGFGFLGGRSAASIAAAGPSLQEAGLNYPVLTLRESALRGNARAMAEYCARHEVDLAPHGKTAMSPELAALQLVHGAWGITVASIGQMRVYREFGFPRLLLANELVDQTGIAWLAAELAADPDFEPYCYVDSVKAVDLLDSTIRSAGIGARALPVLVEIGHQDGRTGCRTDAEALAVAKAAARTGTLRVAGIAGYEGTIGHDGSAQTLDRVAAFSRRLRELADAAREFGSGPGDPLGRAAGDFIVSAGGSTSFDVVTSELTAGDRTGLRVVLRSGAYLAHDHGLYDTNSPAVRGVADAPRFTPAIEIWAQVLSRPEPGLALLGLGRRDAGFDSGLPMPLRVVRRDAYGGSAASEASFASPDRGGPEGASRPGESVTAGSVAGGGSGGCGFHPPENTGTGWQVGVLMDQHAYLHIDAEAELAPGDLVCFGISHPCTTLDKWRVMPVVDDAGHITDVVHAYF
jgi:D-serine dehydratase